jgi:hypothetical protein
MSRSQGALPNIASKLIGEREIPAALRLGEVLASKTRRKWKSKAHPKSLKSGGLEGQIDLLAWTPSYPDEVLLIEYKATLEVAEDHEMDEATQEMMKGQEQLSRCVQILKTMSNQEKRAIYRFVDWEKVTAYYGVVVSSGGHPYRGYDHSVFPAISDRAFATRIESRDLTRPSRVWAAARERQWLGHYNHATFRPIPISIGVITYFVPALVMPGEEIESFSWPS